MTWYGTSGGILEVVAAQALVEVTFEIVVVALSAAEVRWYKSPNP
jgi:hypothetical protein